MRRAVCVAMLYAVLVAGPSRGREVESTPLPQIVAQQKQLNAAILAREPAFDYLDDYRRRSILRAQEKVFRLTDGRSDIAELSPDDRIVLFNALKRIQSALVKGDADDRLVCERSSLTGSRRQQLACMNKAEHDERAERARAALMNRPACTQPGCL